MKINCDNNEKSILVSVKNIYLTIVELKVNKDEVFN